MMVLAGGLLAGLAGFGFGEYSLRLFAPSLELPPGIKGDQTLAPREHARRVRESPGPIATLSYGVLGAFLGLALGAAGGLARRSPRAAITAALIGLLLGAAAGAGTTFLILPWYHASYALPSPENANQQLGLALATHGGIWMAVGAVAGLALGLGLGGGRFDAGHRRRDPGRGRSRRSSTSSSERSSSRWTGPICPWRWHRRRGCWPTSPWRSACPPGHSGPPII